MDLAKREVRLRAIPQRTFRRETTMPRQATDLPGLEVNQPINRADMSGADALSNLLGLANNVGQKIAGDIQEGKDQESAAQAVMDFTADAKDDKRFARSHAYRNAWQKEGAKKLALDVSQEVTDAVNAALNDEENPPTPDEIDTIVESVFRKHTHDESGQLLDFGTPEAKTILGHALAEVKSTIMPQALKAIKDHTDERFLATRARNAIYEHFRGSPIGTPIQVDVSEADDPAPASSHRPVPPGWKGNVEDAIQELGMTASQAQEFIRTGKDPRGAPRAPVSGRPVEPFSGFSSVTPTSRMGAAREGGSTHNGEDFPVPEGTAIKAPMAGTVVGSYSNARGGNQVRVKLADGSIVGFAHLSKRDVKQGDTVRAGQLLGLSGNTGRSTGPHVHMTVEKGGRKVSPSQYFRSARMPGEAVAALGDEPELLTQAPATAAPAYQPAPLNFESLMADLPPSLSRAKAKDYFLKAVIAEAAKNDDPALLKGLEDSVRKDGTPSFDPEDIAKIVSARDQLSDKVRIKAERAEKDMHDENEERIFQALLSDNPPSKDFIIQAGDRGMIDSRFAYSIVHSLESEERMNARADRAEARQAEAEAEGMIDVEIGTLITERHAGIGDTSAAHDKALFESGRLGGGKKAVTRFRQLRAAAKAAETMRSNSPDAARYGKTIEALFKPRAGRSSGTAVERARGAGTSSTGDAAAYGALVNAYNGFIKGGMNPGEAYLKAVTQYGPKGAEATEAARKSMIRVMQARRLSAGR